DKTGTITSPTATALVFDGELNRTEKDILYSICRNSNHPLSREILKGLGDCQVLPVADYTEIVGQGQSAPYLDYTIGVRSSSFVGDSRKTEGTSVYVKINKEIYGVFTLEHSWRSGLNEVVQALKSGDYNLHLISGDNERRAEALKVIFPSQSNLLFNQNPSDKLQRIEQWQSADRK